VVSFVICEVGLENHGACFRANRFSVEGFRDNTGDDGGGNVHRHHYGGET